MRPLALLTPAILLAGCEALRAPESRGDFYTTVYLTAEEALQVVFPGVREVVRDEVALAPAERREVEKLLGARVIERAFPVYIGKDETGGADGFALILEEIGKFKPITFIVGVEPDGSVRRVAVMVYREARGGEVAQRRFLVQYPGKTVEAPLSINRDIINVTGATMSVSSMNHGVKKALAVLEVAYLRDPGRLSRALRQAPAIDLERGAADARANAAVASSPGRSSPVRVREARWVMGSLCEIEAWGDDEALLRSAVREAFLEIERADRALSDWRPDSELSRVSREGARRAVPVSEMTAEFLERAREVAEASNGAFDVTAGALVDLWGVRGGRRSAPSADELAAVRPLVDWRQVRVERRGAEPFARLGREGLRLDPGALGKGFAVDLAVAVLERRGVRSALVDFSGNIRALGAPPGEDAWLVAVRDPARPGAVLGTLALRDEAVASSGGYEKWVEIDGVRRSHVLSPLTLRPVDRVLGATVRAKDAALADGWSTAAMVLGEEALRCLAPASDIDAAVTFLDGGRARLVTTPRFWSSPLDVAGAPPGGLRPALPRSGLPAEVGSAALREREREEGPSHPTPH